MDTMSNKKHIPFKTTALIYSNHLSDFHGITYQDIGYFLPSAVSFLRLFVYLSF